MHCCLNHSGDDVESCIMCRLAAEDRAPFRKQLSWSYTQANEQKYRQTGLELL